MNGVDHRFKQYQPIAREADTCAELIRSFSKSALERIREVRPEIPVMVCSGFGDVDVESRFADKNIGYFLAKPYTVKQLARKVKECIAAGATGL